MRIAVTSAKGQLTELVRRAQAGEEVVLTRHGRAVVRLAPVEARVAPEARRALLEAARASGARKARPGGQCCAKPGFPLWLGRLARMIAVDTSALLAIALGEADTDACIGVLTAKPEIVISAGPGRRSGRAKFRRLLFL